MQRKCLPEVSVRPMSRIITATLVWAGIEQRAVRFRRIRPFSLRLLQETVVFFF
jgi:hypothetical protein